MRKYLKNSLIILGCLSVLFLIFAGAFIFKSESESRSESRSENSQENINFRNMNTFKEYFNALDTQHDKNWALAAAAVLCKKDMVSYAAKHGADMNTEVEIVRMQENYSGRDRWVFVDGENWENYYPKEIDIEGLKIPIFGEGLDAPKHYLPMKHAYESCLDCFGISHPDSLGKLSIKEIMDVCGDNTDYMKMFYESNDEQTQNDLWHKIDLQKATENYPKASIESEKAEAKKR
ncbi:MAG: hypothetical protein J6J35_06890 [Alphaproteobacteria bacterium]|nr:hypothetical protein [Alphaproteobacteria bacterium]